MALVRIGREIRDWVLDPARCGDRRAVSTHVYRSDLNWADEGSHYVSGLMVHDYVADKLPGSPIAYATRYYIHYPKVGIGHWPPLYYLVEAGGFFLTGPSIRAALFLEAVFAAGVAATVGWVVYRIGGRIGGWIPAVAASLATLAAPEVFLGMQGDMLDIPIALMALLAMLAWARFLFDEDAMVRRLRPSRVSGNNDKGQRRCPRSGASVFDSSIEPIPIVAQLAVLAARADHRSVDRALVFADLQNYG